MITHHDASSFGILIEGSVDNRAEAKVQRSKSTMMRSNFDRQRPVSLVAMLLNVQPGIAIPTPIALPATEWGAKATYKNSPTKMSFWLSRANEPWLESDLSKCVVNELESVLKIGPNDAGNRPAELKIGALTPLYTRVSVSLGVLWSGKGDVDKQHHRLLPLLAATIKATR